MRGLTITSFTVRDLRWPTSLENIGSDPMNLAGENSLGYLQYHTDVDGLVGTGWSFANGQGNEYVSLDQGADIYTHASNADRDMIKESCVQRFVLWLGGLLDVSSPR